MAQSPPHVEVTTTGVKQDYGDPPERSVKTPLPTGAARVPDRPRGGRGDD